MRVVGIVFVGLMAGVLGFLGKDLGLRDWVLIPEDKMVALSSPTESSFNSTQPQVLGVDYKDSEISVAWMAVENSDTITLHPNFSEKKVMSTIIQNNECGALVNGGFYRQDIDEIAPIGLFVAQRQEISEAITNSTLNGYFAIGEDGRVGIGFSLADKFPRLALQSGPVLIENGSTKTLKLQRDKQARRTVVGVTKGQITIFMAFYNQDSVFMGPLLADLPQLVRRTESKIGVEFEGVLNLDGGAASAFYGKGVELSELSTVGSYFCID